MRAENLRPGRGYSVESVTDQPKRLRSSKETRPSQSQKAPRNPNVLSAQPGALGRRGSATGADLADESAIKPPPATTMSEPSSVQSTLLKAPANISFPRAVRERKAGPKITPRPLSSCGTNCFGIGVDFRIGRSGRKRGRIGRDKPRPVFPPTVACGALPSCFALAMSSI